MDIYMFISVVIGAIYGVQAQTCPTTTQLQNKNVNVNGNTYTIPTGTVYSTEDNDDCYILLRDQPRAWSEGVDFCHFMANSLGVVAELQGRMAKIKSKEEQDKMVAMLKPLVDSGAMQNDDKMWLGAQFVSDVNEVKLSGFGKNTNYPVWRATPNCPSCGWLTDRADKPKFELDPRLMVIQGCFWETTSFHTVRVENDDLPPEKVTPASCEDQCDTKGMQYFAVRVEDDGPRCICLYGGYAEDPDGDGPYDAVTGSNSALFPNEPSNAYNFYCREPCIADPQQFCGGRRQDDPNAGGVYGRYAQLVGVVNGVNSTLPYGWQQPSYDERIQNYVVLEMETWEVHDVAIYPTFATYPVICETVPVGSSCQSPSQPLGTTGKCVYFSSSIDTNAYMDYYQARKTCRDMGGDIVMFELETEWEALKGLYRDMVQRGQEVDRTHLGTVRYIIGQTGREWLWADYDEFTYTNFDSRQPRMDELCLNMFVNPSGERFVWETAKCSSQMYTLCELTFKPDEVDQCASNPCTNGGDCQDGFNSFTCRCAPGWTGATCNINIDDCLPVNPCQNGGQCVDGVASYTCQCTHGWDGQDCTINVDSCPGVNPCKNGGQCVDELSGYSCRCADGFEGDNCRTNTDDCPLFPACLNGGVCIDGINTRVCRCPNGFNGDRCQNNECDLFPCLNGGNCTDGRNNRTCHCAEGFTGDSCEINILECAVRPCRNGGTCKDGINERTCECREGYTGVDCEISVDDCASEPCKNGGICTDGLNTVTCKCADGWTGDTCNIKVSTCAVTPCENRGKCTDVGNSRTCECPDGYSGESCQTNIDECVTEPCQNGGTCTDGVAKRTCQCLEGWAGDSCEIRIRSCTETSCQNGGNCTDVGNSRICQCLDGWSGESCEINVDECVTRPCENGGTCIDGINNRTCQCPTGYTGDSCQTIAGSCTPTRCANSGTCKLVNGAVECTCTAEWGGPFCTIPLKGSTHDSSSLSTFEIALIIILIIIFIIILLAIIFFCWYKKKDKRRKQINAYDARPEAPVPYSGHLGEEIYLAESDKAGLFSDPSVFRNPPEQNYYSARSPRVTIGNHDDHAVNTN